MPHVLDHALTQRLAVVLVLMESSFLSKVYDASDQEGAPHPITSYLLLPPLPQISLPCSGYRGSDLVLWHRGEILGGAASPSGLGWTSAVPAWLLACLFVRTNAHVYP